MLAQPLLQHEQVPKLRGNPLAFDTFGDRILNSAFSHPSFVFENTSLSKLLQAGTPARGKPVFDGDRESLFFSERHFGADIFSHDLPQDRLENASPKPQPDR